MSSPAAGPRHTDARLSRLIDWYEGLTPQSLGQLGEFYAPHAQFKDPFNDVSGVAAISAIFEHMFKALRQPRFEVREVVLQGDDAFLVWDFLFQFRGADAAVQCVRGTTHLKWGADGRITWHRDYWDAAEELYEKLPVVGALMRWLKRRARG